MSMVTDNEAITNLRIATPQMLPVVIPWNEKGRSGVHALGDVRQLDSRDLALFLNNRRQFEAIYGAAEVREKELLFVIQLADAIAERSLLRLRKALRTLLGPEQGEKELRHPGGYSAIRDLSRRLNFRIATACPITFWSDSAERLVFAWHAPNIQTALFLLALGNVSVSALGECKGCRGVLIRERPNKHFCDANCRSRFYMREMRKRQAERKKKAKGGK